MSNLTPKQIVSTESYEEKYEIIMDICIIDTLHAYIKVKDHDHGYDMCFIHVAGLRQLNLTINFTTDFHPIIACDCRN